MNDYQMALLTAKLNCQSTACWRESVAEHYPADPRNAKTAESLRELSTKPLFDESHWPILEPFFKASLQRWIRSLTLTNKSIGFQAAFPKDSSDYAALLYRTLSNYDEITTKVNNKNRVAA